MTSPALSAARLSRRLLELLDRGTPAAALVALSHPEPTLVGARLLVFPDGTAGSFGDPRADEAARRLARQGLEGDPNVESGRYPLPLDDGGEMEAYLDLHHPQPELVIVGAGHLAQPLSTLGSLLGLRVRVLDDRPEFATRERFPEASEVADVDFADPFRDRPFHSWTHLVLVTRGHRYDYECLRKVLLSPSLPGYIGMIGSRRRVRATFRALLEEGVPRNRLALVRAPIGLDLGAESPAEIAVSVAAELVHFWRGGSGRPLREVASVLERHLPSREGGKSPGTEGG